MQQYFYKKSNFKPTPGRHIKSYEQLQSLIHEAFMKILLKILKRKDRSSGIKKKKRVFGSCNFRNQEKDSLHSPFWKCHESCSSSQHSWSLALSRGSLVFIINSYFQSNKGENSSGKNKKVSNPGSNISLQCCD